MGFSTLIILFLVISGDNCMEKQTFSPQNDRIIGNLIPDFGEVLDESGFGQMYVQHTFETSTVNLKGSARTIINMIKSKT